LFLPFSEERRRFQRVRVNLLGRYMLADRREYACQVVNMSPGGMALIAPVRGETSERVIAYQRKRHKPDLLQGMTGVSSLFGLC
jgi:hypothetical protein